MRKRSNNFLVNSAGFPLLPEEMVKDWLGVIGSKVEALEKDGEEILPKDMKEDG